MYHRLRALAPVRAPGRDGPLSSKRGSRSGGGARAQRARDRAQRPVPDGAGNHACAICRALPLGPFARARRRRGRAAASTRKAPRRKPKKTVTSELARLYGAGDITQAQYNGYKAAWNSALGTERRLRGTRKAQLAGVISEPPADGRRRLPHPVAAARPVSDPGAKPAVLEDGPAAQLRPAGRVQRLAAGVGVLPGPGNRADCAGELRRRRRLVYRGTVPLPRAPGVARRADSAGGDARRQPHLGVLLQVRRRHRRRGPARCRRGRPSRR